MNMFQKASLFCLLFSTFFWGCDSTTVSPEVTPVAEYLHVRADWSPDGKTIAFSSLVQNATGMMLVDSSGANLKTISSGDVLGATWSPDGLWIGFTQAGTLYTIKANGDSLRPLANVTNAIRPSWSPTGKKIAYVPRDAGTGVWLYDLATASATMLIAYGSFPSWNRLNGEVVILDARYDIGTGVLVYYFVGVDPTTRLSRTIGAFATVSDCGFSRISPDGNTILYSLKRPDDYVQIWSYDILRSQHKQLTTDGGDFAAWSPDGKKIVYTRTQAGDGTLWVMNPDGSGKRQLTKR